MSDSMDVEPDVSGLVDPHPSAPLAGPATRTQTSPPTDPLRVVDTLPDGQNTGQDSSDGMLMGPYTTTSSLKAKRPLKGLYAFTLENTKSVRLEDGKVRQSNTANFSILTIVEDRANPFELSPMYDVSALVFQLCKNDTDTDVPPLDCNPEQTPGPSQANVSHPNSYRSTRTRN